MRQIKIQKIINKRDCTEVMVRFIVDDALDQLRIVFWKDYIGKQQRKEISFYIPKTWKDHFKKTYRNNRIMEWRIKKHPIKTKKLRFKLKKIHIFPDIAVPQDNKFQERVSYLEVVKE